MSRRRSRVLAASAALLALGLAACSSTAETPAASGTSSTSDGSASSMPAEPVKVTIGALTISETAPLWGAVKAGVFADHGLDVTIQPIQGGAQAMPALINGEVDFTVGQPFGVMRARDQGLEVSIISNYAESLREGPDINSVVTGAGTGITSAKDLSGKTVAVNSLGAAGDLTIKAAVDADGGDSSTIKFVEVAFPDVPAQIEAGNIDAAWVPEPFVSMVVGAGGARVVDPYQATIPGLPTLVVQATQKTIDEKPELVQAMREALADAFTWSEANESEMRQSLVDNMSLPEDAAANLPLPHFTATIDRTTLQALADLAVRYGYFKTAPDLNTIIVEG
ncbi:MAG: ABC transporter substrate-binding protein [Actinomycetales bacterium]|nr:ABC transporter substrate-binding protein [Actinomycetales bacterium]